MASFPPPRSTQSAQELEEAVCNIPLLMKELPKDFSTNPVLLGLQSLLYSEGTPLDIAEQLKKQGNEQFLKNTWTSFHAALKLYTEALEQPLLPQEHPELLSSLYSNRAAVYFSLQHFESCIQDCLKALALHPRNIKAIDRLARCHANYKNYEKALDVLEKGLSISPSDPRLNETLSVIQQAYTTWKSQPRTAPPPWHAWFQEYQVNNVTTSRIPYPTVTTSPWKEDHRLYLPLVLGYPEFHQFDHLPNVEVEATFREVLTPVFESTFPWDPHYTLPSIQVYVWCDSQRQQVRMVSLSSTLLDTLHQPGVVTFNGVMELILVHAHNPFAKNFRKHYQIDWI
ncbi:Tetratricopeptide repeat protein 4 [Coelomomyces lativittatus]|nr:Tetratricopeptide repeat protein 4 [Coelomomyces lativittatus]